MARRKRQPTPDPLAGPEEATAAARAEAEAKAVARDYAAATEAASPELKPFMIQGQLIGARYNAEGEPIGLEAMGTVEILRANFGNVDQMIDEAVERARQAAG